MGKIIYIEKVDPSVSRIPITRKNEPEIYKVIYRVAVPEDIPIGSAFEWNVQAQLVHPEDPFKAGVAWLWAVEMRAGPDQDDDTIAYMMPKGRIGENIYDEQHYASYPKTWRWFNKMVVKKGWCVGYRGRARSYTTDAPSSAYVDVWDNGGIQVKITVP